MYANNRWSLAERPRNPRIGAMDRPAPHDHGAFCLRAFLLTFVHLRSNSCGRSGSASPSGGPHFGAGRPRDSVNLGRRLRLLHLAGAVPLAPPPSHFHRVRVPCWCCPYPGSRRHADCRDPPVPSPRGYPLGLAHAKSPAGYDRGKTTEGSGGVAPMGAVPRRTPMGDRAGGLLAPTATPGSIFRTNMPAAAPTAGARTASPASPTTGCAGACRWVCGTGAMRS